MTAEKKLLVVEDEKNISDIIKYNVEAAGYSFTAAFDGEEGLKQALTLEYDLILLDVMLPKMDGFEICRRLRNEKINTPIIMVTAREDEVDKVLGLELGADDYITKPFGVKELMARIKANIRRSSAELSRSEPESAEIAVDSLLIDCGKYSVKKKGAEIALSKIEYDLLLFLAKNRGQIFSREQLLSEVWKYGDFYGDAHTVDVTVSRLRVKIEDNPAKPSVLKTKRNVGYFVEG